MKPEYPPDYDWADFPGTITIDQVLHDLGVYCGMLRMGMVCGNDATMAHIRLLENGRYDMFAFCDMCLNDMN